MSENKSNKKQEADRKSKWRIASWKISSRVLMIVVAALLALSYLSAFLNPARLWILTIFGLLFIPLMIVNLVLLVLAIKRRSKTFLIPLIALLPSFYHLGAYVQFSGGKEAPQGQLPVKVISYNVGHFNNASALKQAECMDSIFVFLRSQDADIICLQEFRYSDSADLDDFLKRHFPDYYSCYYIFNSSWGRYGNVILSRSEPRGKGVIKFDQSRNLAIYADYTIGGDALRVYNCHFESYHISLSGIASSLLERDKEEIMAAESKMKRGISRRPQQVNKVFEHIEGSPVPAVVCGDFNDSPTSYTYYKMSRRRKDSFREAGKGFGATYSGMWPLLRIDYVLFPDRYDGFGHACPHLPYSDHYPVVATFGIRM